MLKFKLFGKDYCISRKIVLAAILPGLLIVALIFISGYYISRNTNGIIVQKKSAEDLTEEAITTGQTQDIGQMVRETRPKIKVYVTGSVMHPGVVEIYKGQIIQDAINAAGGIKSDADLENINLAYILNENVMIKVKSKSEVQSEMKSLPSAAANGNVQSEAGNGIAVSKDSGGAVAGQSVSQVKTDTKININTATLDELDQLDGVGQATAKRIMDYREKFGPFKTIEDIKNVSGIGEAKFNSFKDMITVG